MILRYILYWPINGFLVLTAWALSSPLVIAALWWFGALGFWSWTLPLFLFSAPSLAALSFMTGPKLPGILRWFSTLNATLDGGIEQGVDGFDPNAKGFKLWWQRTLWTYRNPCNGWQSELLGIRVIDHGFTVKKDVPLFGGVYIKLWLGWNPNKRGGNYYPFMFQMGVKRK